MLELLKILPIISDVTESTTKIASFVTGSELLEVLGAVGTRHITSAKLVLQDAELSTRPSDRLNSAANSLTEAFALLSPRYQFSINRFFRGNILLVRGSQERMYMQSCVCATLIAVLYKFLGESRTNVEVWIQRAEEELTAWGRLYQKINGDSGYRDYRTKHKFENYVDRTKEEVGEVKSAFAQIKFNILALW